MYFITFKYWKNKFYSSFYNLCTLIITNCLFSENYTQNSELLDFPVLNCDKENVIPTVLENQQVFNYEPNHFNPKLHSKNIKNEIKFSSITILHIILSQIVLVLFYYDLGFLFGNVSNI